jgi:putative flippase GtrA
MFVLYNVAGCGYWFSSASAYIAGSAQGFFLNKYFTFQIREWSLRIVIAYIATIAGAYAIAYSIARPAISYLLNGYSKRYTENISLFTGMCIFTALNYMGQRFIVFRRSSK